MLNEPEQQIWPGTVPWQITPGGGHQRAAFRRLRATLEGLAEPALDTLSMGTSADLEAAVAEGATIVRVGTAIFGPRA